MSLFGTAVHESSHAIVGLAAFGRPIASISIEADGSGTYRASGNGEFLLDSSAEGETRSFRGLCQGLTSRDLPFAEQKLIVLLAGEAAQARIDGAAIAAQAAEIDVSRATMLAAAVTETASDGLALLASAWSRAEQHVSAYWPQVVAIAHELAARGALTEADIWAILARAASAAPHRVPDDRSRIQPGLLRRRSSRVYWQGPPGLILG